MKPGDIVKVVRFCAGGPSVGSLVKIYDVDSFFLCPEEFEDGWAVENFEPVGTGSDNPFVSGSLVRALRDCSKGPKRGHVVKVAICSGRWVKLVGYEDAWQPIGYFEVVRGHEVLAPFRPGQLVRVVQPCNGGPTVGRTVQVRAVNNTDLFPSGHNEGWLHSNFVDAKEPEPTTLVDIVFDAPPGPVSGRFIETELPDGTGVGIGEWIVRDDGYNVLRIEVNPSSVRMPPPPETVMVELPRRVAKYYAALPPISYSYQAQVTAASRAALKAEENERMKAYDDFAAGEFGLPVFKKAKPDCQDGEV